MTQARLPADPWPAQNSRVENRAQPRPSGAQQHYPILIGISGKRIFDHTNAQADCAIAEALADRFRTLFEGLDRDLPGTPKIVLTGAAFGADLIAVTAERRGWLRRTFGGVIGKVFRRSEVPVLLLATR